MTSNIIIRRGGRWLSSPQKSFILTQKISSCHYFSTNPSLAGEGNQSQTDAPPIKRHSQSFVHDDQNLELGELETDLPPGYHQHLHRGPGPLKRDRHANDGKDSYWRPPFANPRVEIISKDDFVNRPRVQFGEAFQSLHDGQIVLSWMSQDDKDKMYKLYVDMMTAQANENKKNSSDSAGDDIKDKKWGVLSTNTSHEYVIRVIAQSFNMSTSRAAGVIQLQHNEEQLKKDPTFELQHAVQAHVDTKVNEWIREVYRSYGETAPLQFTEDPVSSTGLLSREDTEAAGIEGAPELVDVDALLKRTKNMERSEAEARINNHQYVEDVDERTRNVKIDRETTFLMTRAKELSGLYEVKEETEDSNATEEGDSEVNEPVIEASSSKKTKGKKKNKKRSATPVKIPKGASPFPENNRGYKETPETRRPRWKFAAQIINTHKLENPSNSSRHGKSAAARSKARRHGRVVDGNTIIEESGQLRTATVAELEQTSWKHVRNESEFMFKGVKEAWLRRELEGESGGWGPQSEVQESVEEEPR